MKQLWIAIVVLFVLGVIGSIFLGFQYWQYRSMSKNEKDNMVNLLKDSLSLDQLEQSGQEFIDRVIPQVIADWSVEKYLSYMQAKESSDKELGIITMYLSNVAREYGSMVKYLDSQGDIQLRGSSIKDAVVFAEYSVRAIFEHKGETTFKVSLTKTPGEDQWYLEGFHGL